MKQLVSFEEEEQEQEDNLLFFLYHLNGNKVCGCINEENVSLKKNTPRNGEKYLMR